jgi:hypothetical protein
MFDAILFFIILISASIFVFIIPSAQSNQSSNILQSQYRNEFVESTLRAVLKSTLDSTSFSNNGARIEIFDSDVQTVIKNCLVLKYETRNDSKFNLTQMENDIETVFRTTIPSEYEFSVYASYSKASSLISEAVFGSNAPRATKYSASLEFTKGDENYGIMLSVWN